MQKRWCDLYAPQMSVAAGRQLYKAEGTPAGTQDKASRKR